LLCGLVESAKLVGVEPDAYLRTAKRHAIVRRAELQSYRRVGVGEYGGAAGK
jgi:hypothetical protein